MILQGILRDRSNSGNGAIGEAYMKLSTRWVSFSILHSMLSVFCLFMADEAVAWSPLQYVWTGLAVSFIGLAALALLFAHQHERLEKKGTAAA